MITAIVCAAGKGSRAGFSQNKLLCDFLGMPVLLYAVSAFSQSSVDEILVVCSKEDEPRIAPLLSPYPNAQTVLGGETRGQSVLNALQRARGEIVLVHDGARPFLSQKIIADCIACVKKYGSAICALPSTDTTVIVDGDKILNAPARDTVYTVQTPQAFYRDELLQAYLLANGASFTDESSLFAHFVRPPTLFLGERENRKLTFADDFRIADRVGFGVDTHAFGTENRPIVLGGVQIPSERGLIAHSDGDVLIHALMDALLSAAGLRDIGYYFPDTDERFRGANSTHLLQEVVCLVREAGFRPMNASISVLAERPRLSPYIQEMKRVLAPLLHLDESAVAIAAGTNEKLGYVGEGKGITVYANVLLTTIL